MRATWPVPIESLGPASVATVVFRHRAAFHLTVVVKGSFQWVQGGRAQPMEASPIERADRHRDADPKHALDRAHELSPFLPRAEVHLAGHAYAPPGAVVPAASVRLGVFRDVARIEKTVHVYGDRRTMRDPPRPFQRMPLRWELAFGGPGTANPVGTGVQGGPVPNLIAPDVPQRPACFGPMPRSWPTRAARVSQLHGLDAPVFDLEDDLDFAVFQSVPDDQLVDGLHGDEWILVDGVHPSLPRLSTQLPAARPAALVWCEHGPSAGMRWSPQLALDMVLIDADRLRLDVVWRGSFTLPEGDAMVADVRAAAGIETEAPLAWPDVDAAMRTARLRRPAPRVEDAMREQRTLAQMPAVSEGLPFASAMQAVAVRGQAVTSDPPPAQPATPWETAPPGRPAFQPTRGTVAPPSAGDTPLPGDEPLPPVLPFAAARGEAVVAEPTDADDHREDVETTFDALATGSTAPPPPGESVDVPIPPPPPAPVVVPPPAVGPARTLGGFALSYGAGGMDAPASPGEAALATPSVVPAPPLPEPPRLDPPPLPRGSLASVPELPDAERTVAEPLAAEPTVAEPAGTRAPAEAATPAADATGALAPPRETPRARIERRLLAKESLDGADLARLDLAGLDFSGVSLVRANLAGASLRGCRMVGARLSEAKLAGADLEDADLSDAKGSRPSFARARLVNATLVGAELANADFSSAHLTGADLSGAQLSDAVLEDVQGEGARFEGARLLRVRGNGARFPRAHLDRVDASGSAWDRAVFDGASLAGAVLTDASLLRASLVAATLRDADLRGAKLSNASAEDANLERARLDGADLRQARFDGARFDGAKLHKLVGTKASMNGASLAGADLRGANLRGARLTGADFTGASLRDADLRDADLASAQLEGADCAGARLQGANLEGATGIDPALDVGP